MKRRQFLKTPLAFAALASLAKAAEAVTPATPRTRRGFRAGAGESHDDAVLPIMGGSFALKVSGRDTGGDLCIYDTVRNTKGGPPLHRHLAQDEWFYVIRGEFVVQVADAVIRLGPGDSAFAPRGLPHAFAMTSEGEGQMLVLFQPAGRMEHFFHEMSRRGKDVTASRELPKSVWEDCGMELLGPPLKY